MAISNVPDWELLLLTSDSTIEETIMSFETNAIGFRIVHDSGKFVGVITNGDLRRSFLSGVSALSKTSEIANLGAITVSESTNDTDTSNLMKKFGISYIPVVSEDSKVVGLKQYSAQFKYEPTDATIIFIAGGKGTRLLTETENLPKPLVQVQGKPILEHLISKAYLYGFRKIVISVGHLGHKVEEYFGDGRELDIEILYLRENVPLGTGGPLSLLHESEINISENFIVANADVFSDIDLRAFLNFHINSDGLASIVGKFQQAQIPFGVLTVKDEKLFRLDEKPTQKFLINAGIYAFKRKVIQELEPNVPISMPDFLTRLISQGGHISVYQNEDDWIDIGTPETLHMIREW